MPSLSDPHFRIEAIEIFSYACFEIQNTCIVFKTGGSDGMPNRKFGFCTNEFESIFADIKRPTNYPKSQHTCPMLLAVSS